MKAIRSNLMTALACALIVPAASAATYRVDDSASEVIGNTVQMRWDTPTPEPGRRQVMSGDITVLVRLDVAQWKGRQGRIYMILPAQSFGQVTANWTTRGRLLPGTLRSGERTLVHSGPITDDRIEDTLYLQIDADGRYLTRTEQLNFSFEIDVE
ncbi:hypothetical protein MNR01_11425 [Lysobacter sp. S4-A87]|uniref:hypothetical protein n=1 Tax=Lysobacter sp. S4-A87 TaxID=2925843 RepID=UPI001F52F7E5|nr:hypothetical protein [Lysobacter sp. S4-A87]UNK48378.1 hypothetical protein MNR01_11425 [Lysobacter sp. S4-A87]